nr:hypothetical protein [Kibdelosporangium sp. MJ126-NF4]CEL15156.1 PE-PGRS FAMILY PROTEIN [Kibdelosporangium sp. MJ126-NF4]CTQ93248.1 PE-PGRS FAMILY PROTEIN [Kibdelosporangium sp. MJ126-NF4]
MAVPEPSDLIKDIAPWVLGGEWPHGDEDAMIRLAEVWETAAKDIDAAMKAADGAVRQARANFDGPSAQQFDEFWAKFVQGDDAAFTKLKDGSEQLAKACRTCAMQIEYAKLSIRAALAALVIQVIAMIAASFATFGGSLAGIMPAQLATRQVIVTIFRTLVQRLGEQVDRNLLHRMVFSVATEVAANVPTDAGIQLVQLAKGTREESDANLTLDAAKSGAISGVLGGAASSAVKGAISGNFSLESIAQSATSGATNGGLSGIPSTSGSPSPTPGSDRGPHTAAPGRPDHLTPEQTPSATRDTAVPAVGIGARPPSPRPHGGAFPESGPQRFSGNLDMSPPPVLSDDDRPASGASPDHPKDLERLITSTRSGTHLVVDVHGTADKDIADIIRASGWDGKQPVLLVGCQTGSKPDGFAARLSRELGGEVTAPNRDAWTDDRGNLFASSSHMGPKDLRPGWPPNGEWATFKPDGTSTPHSQSSPPGHVPDWRAADGPDRAYRRGEAPGSSNGPTTSPPCTAERPVGPRHAHESEANPGTGDTRPPKFIAPEGTPLFFENRPDFRATSADVHHMRQSYGLDTWYRDAGGIDGIIASNPHLQHIPRDQLIALRGHTAPPAFKVVNEALRTNDIQTLRRYEGYVKVVNSALNQLPPFQGVVQRVVNTDHPALRASQYRYDAEVTERAFLSGSAGGPSRTPGKVVLQIHSLTGRDVSVLAHRPHEREVLFPSGTRFKVIGTGFDQRTGTHYVQMREIPASQAPRPGVSPMRSQQGPRPVYSGPQPVRGGQQQPYARPPMQHQQQPVRQPVHHRQAVPNRTQATAQLQPLRRPQGAAPQPVRQETHTAPVTQPLRKPEFDYNAHRPIGAPPRTAEDFLAHSAESPFGADPEYKAPPPTKLTPDEVRAYLDGPDFAASLDAAERANSTVDAKDENGAKIQLPVAEVIRDRLPNHPELVDAMRRTGYLEPSLLAQPKTIASLLVHPKTIPALIEAVHEVDTKSPEAVSECAGSPRPVDLNAEQQAITDTADRQNRRVRDNARLQVSMQPGETVSSYLDARYADAAIAQEKLTALARQWGHDLRGHAVPRTALKNRTDAERYASPEGKFRGDPTMLVDIAGAYIQFTRLVDVYRALDRIFRDSDIRIVNFKDRFRKPQDSGYGDIQMSVSIPTDVDPTRTIHHVAELRLRLHPVDDVAEFEHAPYEVRRNPDENDPHGKALIDAIVLREQQLFRAALNQKGVRE